MPVPRNGKEAANVKIDLLHLCLVYLAEDFTGRERAGDTLVRYLQSVFVKKSADPEYNPYAEYSRSIQKEADEIMTIVGMFEERAERRGEKRGVRKGEERLKKLFHRLKQEGREEEINQILIYDNTQLLEKLYTEYHL